MFIYVRKSSASVTVSCVVFQGARQESPSSCSQEVLKEALRGPGPYPMVVLPPGGGYWVEGESAIADYPPPSPAPQSWRTPKIESDDTAKCYRKFFHGRVSDLELYTHLE